MDGSGSGPHIGVQNDIIGSGNGNHYGVNSGLSSSGSGNHFGVRNILSGTGTGTKYASYDSILTIAGGNGFGVFSSALDTANDYAGFFRGKVSIGMDYTNNYVMPTTRGTNNQIITTDGNGIASWSNPRNVIDTIAWLTRGNSTTDTSRNFIGTLDNMPLKFAVNNVRAGLLDHGRGNNFIGKLAGTSNTSGQRNNALGTYALYTKMRCIS